MWQSGMYMCLISEDGVILIKSAFKVSGTNWTNSSQRISPSYDHKYSTHYCVYKVVQFTHTILISQTIFVFLIDHFPGFSFIPLSADVAVDCCVAFSMRNRFFFRLIHRRSFISCPDVRSYFFSISIIHWAYVVRTKSCSFSAT